MAAIAVPAIRQRIAAAIDAVSGFSQSRFAGPLFARDTDHTAHRAFAVEVADTAPQASRQKLALGARVRTNFIVRWAYRLRADAQVADYDAALTVEAALVAAVMGMSVEDINLHWDGEPQRAVSPAGDWFLGGLTFHVDHLYALT